MIDLTQYKHLVGKKVHITKNISVAPVFKVKIVEIRDDCVRGEYKLINCHGKPVKSYLKPNEYMFGRFNVEEIETITEIE